MNENIRRNLKAAFKKNHFAKAGVFLIALFSIVAILAPVLPIDPDSLNVSERLVAPCLAHPFGTDDMGRDYLARCIYGGRTSLLVGFMAMILSTAIGVFVGTVSGFLGGKTDVVIMRLVDALMSLPTFLLMVVMNAYLDAGVKNVILIIGFLTWMSIARIVRGETLSLKQREYVVYSRVSGQSRGKIIRNHILPNVMPTVIVSATINIAQAILMESALSFFGLGIIPPTASWGSMLNSAQSKMLTAPYLAVFPGLLILLTVISFNYVGEVIRKIYEQK
ncbi:MAG: ABC transporter permease [Eubacteriales bacterium]|nr:ABC transporter permease [Eubacteriales bacterium]